jgi:hypothetical protein
MNYDSKQDTLDHINMVQALLKPVIAALTLRQLAHDITKLYNPEKAIFDEYTPKLKGTTYGSDEYKGYLAEMKVALDHHYGANRHHPEHFPDGIKGMTLVDLIEMICDWKAATLRHADGDIMRSLEVNQSRFGYSDELKQILKNTVEAHII